MERNLVTSETRLGRRLQLQALELCRTVVLSLDCILESPGELYKFPVAQLGSGLFKLESLGRRGENQASVVSKTSQVTLNIAKVRASDLGVSSQSLCIPSCL